MFRERALRLRELAAGHAAGDYLRFVARLAEAQQDCIARLPRPPLPAAGERARRADAGLPPLSALHAPRDPAWHRVLAELLVPMLPASQGLLRAALERALQLSAGALEAQAEALLAGEPADIDVALAPLIGAALQVHWLQLLAQLEPAAIPLFQQPSRCPACGCLPVASVARIGGAEAGYRYLQCALCALEWHRVRLTCTHCGGTAGIHYQSIDDGRPAHRHAIQAECCDGCGAWLKILHLEYDPRIEVVADDLASLALDLLVGASGRPRAGVNFLLVPGSQQD